MDTLDSLIEESAERVLEGLGAKSPERSEAQTDQPFAMADWREVTSAGLHLALLDETAGGVGVAAGLTVARLSGMHAVALPLPEAIAANWLLHQAGLQTVSHPVTLGDGELELTRPDGEWHVRGKLSRVPWGRQCDVVARAIHGGDPFLIRIANEAMHILPGSNYADEPRDGCCIETGVPLSSLAPWPEGLPSNAFLLIGAALRSLQMVGAISKIADLTIEYATQRRQFGRPIGAFQAVQQQLAVLVEEASAAAVAGELAIESVVSMLNETKLAIAKIRTGEAAGTVASIAHQAHGAMGFTREYALQRFTRRLWSWRDEWGNEAQWSVRLGYVFCAARAEALWPQLSAL